MTPPSRPGWPEALAKIIAADVARAPIRYSEGADRWQGVHAVYGAPGEAYHGAADHVPDLLVGDCSAWVTRLWLYALERHLGRVPHDVLNADAWKAGYTGTIAHTLTLVHPGAPRVGNLRAGDLILCGRFPYQHVAIITGPGKAGTYPAAGHGSARGPDHTDSLALLAEFGHIDFFRVNLGAVG